MKPIAVLFVPMLISAGAAAQNAAYTTLVHRSDSLYRAKAYHAAARSLEAAFDAANGKGFPSDRYNAACCWALAGTPDSAFRQLFIIARKSGYQDYSSMLADADLYALHPDTRWKDVLQLVKHNKDSIEAGMNKALIAELEIIYTDDQQYRRQLDGLAQQHGWQSKEVKELWQVINAKDSVNLVKVKAILDKKGWLGPAEIGKQGNNTLFLVVQHSDLHTQEHYLPMMQDAVKKGNAFAAQLALLEDRVALRQGKKQRYGSQVGTDPKTGQAYVLPLEDPDHVDERRRSAGLGSLADYVSMWQLKWDPAQYKKDLPYYEQLQPGTKK